MTPRILSALLAAALVAPVASAQDKPDKPQKPAEPGSKPIIIQLDASKLPPELLKELLKQAKPVGEPTKPGAEKPLIKPGTPEKPVVKPGTPDKPAAPEKPAIKPGVFVKPSKTIGLAEAVAIAEKTAQGTAVKAELKGDVFVIEIKSKKGDHSGVIVDALGRVEGAKGDPNDKKKKDGEKGETGSKTNDKEDENKKGKKKDDDDDDDKGKKGKKKDD